MAGFDGREQGTNHRYQPQSYHYGTVIWLFWSSLPRMVWWCVSRVLQSFCLINGKFTSTLVSIHSQSNLILTSSIF